MSCLFDSVGALTPGGQIAGAEVRRLACAYMRAHLDRPFAHELTLREWLTMAGFADAEAYVERMARASTWGGGVELAVLSKALSVDLRVVDPRGRTLSEVPCSPTRTARHLCVVRWNGWHYTPVRRTDLLRRLDRGGVGRPRSRRHPRHLRLAQRRQSMSRRRSHVRQHNIDADLRPKT